MGNLSNEYLRLEKEVKKAIATGSGMVVAGLPGMGISHFLHLVSEKFSIPIFTSRQEIKDDLVILNPYWLTEEDLKMVDDFYRKADLKRRIILGVNNPSFLYRNELQVPYISSRWYSVFWVRAREKEDLRILAEELGVNLNEDQLNLLELKSSGVGRLAKFFLSDLERLEKTAEELVEDESWQGVSRWFFDNLGKCRVDDLVRMRILEKKGKWKSSFLEEVFLKRESNPMVSVENGVYLLEMGKRSEPLLPFEVMIVNFLINNGWTISRDKIAEIKWGDSQYEQFSDQAINKAMQRLKEKFKQYELIPIPKIGYKLTRR